MVRGLDAQHTNSLTPNMDAIVGEPYDTKSNKSVCTDAAFRAGVRRSDWEGECIRLLAARGLPGEVYVAPVCKSVSKWLANKQASSGLQIVTPGRLEVPLSVDSSDEASDQCDSKAHVQ